MQTRRRRHESTELRSATSCLQCRIALRCLKLSTLGTCVQGFGSSDDMCGVAVLLVHIGRACYAGSPHMVSLRTQSMLKQATNNTRQGAHACGAHLYK